MARDTVQTITISSLLVIIVALSTTKATPSAKQKQYIVDSCQPSACREMCIQDLMPLAETINENPIQLGHSAVGVANSYLKTGMELASKAIKENATQPQEREREALQKCYSSFLFGKNLMWYVDLHIKYMGIAKGWEQDWDEKGAKGFVKKASNATRSCYNGFNETANSAVVVMDWADLTTKVLDNLDVLIKHEHVVYKCPYGPCQ